MTDTQASPPVPAAGVRWDLTPIFRDPAGAARALADALDRAREFERRHRGAMATVDAPALAAALTELGEIETDLSRAASYAALRKAVDVTSEENRDLSTRMERGLVEAVNILRFFELEWLALPDERADELADARELAADRHHLRSRRRYAPHTLSEPEEKALAERDPAARAAWQTLHQQVTSTIEVPFDAGAGAEPHTISRLLSYLHDARRDVRLRTLETLYTALEPHAPVLAHCYDSLVGDRLALDRVRDYGDDPMAQTHLRNELDGEVVEGMLAAVERRYDVAQRWFEVKARLLGLDRLHLADQYAPLGDARTVAFDEGRTLVASAFAGFSPRVADLAGGFFTGRRIDAEPRAGKRGGAFCSPVAPGAPPYVLMNFTGRMTDVLTLAHELGHGMHFALAHERQTPHSAYTGLALAEVPSTFAEFVAFDALLADEKDAGTRQVLLAERVEGAFATVFRQTVLARYEQRAYALRKDDRSLTADRLGEAWLAANADYYGASVELPAGYRLGWSYVPHFISTRFYTYAYVFAKLVALVLLARYREQGDAFVEPYLDFLAAGGSDAPADLLARLGVDVHDPGVWDAGFAELERMLAAAQTEAAGGAGART
jgi:oligoendopeptidase F